MGFSEKGIPFSLSKPHLSLYLCTASGTPCGFGLNILHLFFLIINDCKKSADLFLHCHPERNEVKSKDLNYAHIVKLEQT